MIRRTGFLVLLLAVSVCAAEVAHRSRRHVTALAAPELEGRLTGTEGEALAAAYISKQLEAIGVRPLPGMDGFLQPFDFTAGMHDDGSSLVVVDEAGDERRYTGTDTVQALSFSDNGSVSGPVIFAGYGLTTPDDQDSGYDSYVGLDVKGKIVLVLRYVPEDVEDEQRQLLSRYSGLRYKALNARELGARAVLVVAGPRSGNAGETIPMTFDTALSGSGILAASVSGEVAQRIFSHVEGKTLEQVQEALDTGNPHVQGFDIPGLTLTLEAKVKREKREGNNVLGYLPANVEVDQQEEDLIVLGAHLDHLGHGKHGSSLAKKEEAGGIHYGADDNASGVAAVLLAAEDLVQRKRSRPVIFGFWSGEEMGLLGSSHFVKSELVAAEDMTAYLNFDMVGRMKDNRLSLQSAGSSSVWPGLIEKANVVAGFDLRIQDDPYLPTDATTFYQAGVPTLNFFTGGHEDYHRPTDRADRINFEDLDRVASFGALLTARLMRLEERPDYVKVAPKRENRGDRDTIRAFTGTIPDYTVEVEGLRLGGVIGGGPADQAGLLEGDVIVEFAGRSITNIYDYTYALDAARIDEPVKVVFMRDGERMELTITPTARK